MGTIWNHFQVTEPDYLGPFCGCLGELSGTPVGLTRQTIQELFVAMQKEFLGHLYGYLGAVSGIWGDFLTLLEKLK